MENYSETTKKFDYIQKLKEICEEIEGEDEYDTAIIIRKIAYYSALELSSLFLDPIFIINKSRFSSFKDTKSLSRALGDMLYSILYAINSIYNNINTKKENTNTNNDDKHINSKDNTLDMIYISYIKYIKTHYISIINIFETIRLGNFDKKSMGFFCRFLVAFYFINIRMRNIENGGDKINANNLEDSSSSDEDIDNIRAKINEERKENNIDKNKKDKFDYNKLNDNNTISSNINNIDNNDSDNHDISLYNDIFEKCLDEGLKDMKSLFRVIPLIELTENEESDDDYIKIMLKIEEKIKENNIKINIKNNEIKTEINNISNISTNNSILPPVKIKNKQTKTEHFFTTELSKNSE